MEITNVLSTVVIAVVFVGSMSIIVPERVAKGVEIPQLHLVNL